MLCKPEAVNTQNPGAESMVKIGMPTHMGRARSFSDAHNSSRQQGDWVYRNY